MGKLKVGGIIILIVVVIMATSLGGLAWRYFTAEIRGVVTTEEQIESAPSRIGRYEEFFQLCASAQTQQAALAAQRERLDGMAPGTDRERVRSNIAGLQAQIARNVNQYNSQAAMSYTSGRFQASNLPYQISTQGNIVCAQ